MEIAINFRKILCARSALALLAVAGALLGCSTVGAPLVSPAALGCAQWFEALDAATEAGLARDGAAYRVAGFPWLRVDRFTASFGQEALANDAAFGAWLARLEALDAQGRAAELANMPARDVDVAAQAARCRAELSSVFADVAQRRALAARAQVPGDYSDWKRALGLYPLARGPFFAGVQRWQEQLRARFDRTLADSLNAPMRRYLPLIEASEGAPSGAAERAALGAQDALGIPALSESSALQLLEAHAPALEVQTTGGYDRFGALRWGRGTAPEVTNDQPMAYRRLAWTRWGTDVLPQLIYSFWFPSRPPQSGLDLLAGQLDAVVLRITLGTDGLPLMVDTIHACGCYHLFFPVGSVRAKPAPRSGEEWAFVPKQMPAMRAGERIVVRLESRTHYVVGIDVDTGTSGEGYSMQPDDALRTLSTPDGSTRSAFWPSGIVPGTERGERALFWPMGIDSPGAMRQWGRQSTAFVGRRHFDDARLLDERFDRAVP